MELSGALRVSFDNWGKQSSVYKDLFKSLRKETLVIASKFFEEAQSLKPGTYEVWWAKEHNRFIKDHKQRELLLLHEIMYNFLTEFARGTLERTIDTTAPRGRQKKA